MFVRTQTNGSRTYLLVVDNEWTYAFTPTFVQDLGDQST